MLPEQSAPRIPRQLEPFRAYLVSTWCIFSTDSVQIQCRCGADSVHFGALSGAHSVLLWAVSGDFFGNGNQHSEFYQKAASSRSKDAVFAQSRRASTWCCAASPVSTKSPGCICTSTLFARSTHRHSTDGSPPRRLGIPRHGAADRRHSRRKECMDVVETTRCHHGCSSSRGQF